MPGLSFLFGPKCTEGREQDRIERALDSLIHASNYSKRRLASGKGFVLACTSYPEYPIRVLELPDRLIVIEGKLYTPESKVNSEVSKIGRIAASDNPESRDNLKSWLQDTDGDFLLFILDKETGEILILNDAMGRLPCYCFRKGETFMLSREVRFVANLVERHDFDRMAIAQYLLLGHPLGRRTLLEDVELLPPATLVRINTRSNKVTEEPLHTFNFDSKQHSGRTVEENAEQLVAIFRDSCRNRATRVGTNVVSLSGGLDSRSIAVGLHEEGVPFAAVTYVTRDKPSTPDATIAGLLAKSYGWNWETYSIAPPQGRHFLHLLRTNNGLNHLGMSFILPFFDWIRDKHGTNVTYFTGDGGDSVLTPMRPISRLSNLEELLKFILQERQIMPIKNVATLTQLEAPDIRREILTHIASYPERDLRNRYLHYCFYEKQLRWVYEGEDRNRFHFWSVAPFYSMRLFTHAMNCPDDQKDGYLLYRHFLRRLSPPSAEITHADGAPPALSPNSKWYGIKWTARLLLKERLPIGLKHRLTKGKPYEPSSRIVHCIQEQLHKCDAVQACFPSEAVTDMINRPARYSRHQLENLFSVTSFIEDISTGHSTIERYSDAIFEWPSPGL